MDGRQRSRKLTYLLFLLLLLVVAALVARRLADPQLRAMSLLVRFSDPKAHGFTAGFAQHPVKEELGSAQTPQGALSYRLYIPADVKHPPAMVLLHGVHHLAIEDPRLINLARGLAQAGVEIMTPELKDLADYHVTPQTVDVIGFSAVVLSTRANRPVGVIGLSFAGGLALLTAAKPEYADKMAFVLAVGAHDDMARVARFFVSNTIAKPDGTQVIFQAHEYGALILAYSHLEDYFPARDVTTAQQSMRQWLWEQPQAMQTAARLSPGGREKLDRILHHRDLIRQSLMEGIDRHHQEMDAVSPHNRLSALQVPVYILHGATDSIIPPTEALWLAQDVPKPELKGVLVSAALTHVDMEHKTPVSEEWALINFMGHVLEAADRAEK